MRKALFAALAATALVSGCETYDYARGRADATRGEPVYAEGGDPFGDWRDPFPHRPGPPPCGRYARHCPPPRMAMRDTVPATADDRVDHEALREQDDVPMPRPAPAPARTQAGPWRIQLGAFTQQTRAAALRAQVSALPALSGYETYLVITGGLTRVQAGPLPGPGAAAQLCGRIRAKGSACIVKQS